jgi:hypothetical protein
VTKNPRKKFKRKKDLLWLTASKISAHNPLLWDTYGERECRDRKHVVDAHGRQEAEKERGKIWGHIP